MDFVTATQMLFPVFILLQSEGLVFLRELAHLYVENDFISCDEADTFLSQIPVVGEKEFEPQAKVTDQMLGGPDTDFGNMIPSKASFSADDYLASFIPSQRRAFEWTTAALDSHKQIQVAVVGPAGTGKSYLLMALIKTMKECGLVVAKLAPSGVAAHLIGGKTINNFFALNIQCDSSLENDTASATCVKTTDVLVIDEFSMLDHFFFRTAENLCRKFQTEEHTITHGEVGMCFFSETQPSFLPSTEETSMAPPYGETSPYSS